MPPWLKSSASVILVINCFCYSIVLASCVYLQYLKCIFIHIHFRVYYIHFPFFQPCSRFLSFFAFCSNLLIPDKKIFIWSLLMLMNTDPPLYCSGLWNQDSAVLQKGKMVLSNFMSKLWSHKFYIHSPNPFQGPIFILLPKRT